MARMCSERGIAPPGALVTGEGNGRRRRAFKGADKRGRQEPLCSKECGGIDQKTGVELGQKMGRAGQKRDGTGQKRGGIGQKTGTRVFFTRSQEVKR